MKKSLIYLLVAASLVSVGCSEDFLDPVRNTSQITTEDIANNVDVNPALVEGSINGIGSFLIAPGGVAPGRHYDLGQKGVDIWLDILSGDMALSANSYGWYQNTANLVSTVDYSREENSIIWRYYYKIIALSNNVINSFGGNDAEPDGDQARQLLGQAKAYRAYAYFYLAQIFQRAYDPALPILPYTDGNISIPSKVPASQIYDLILSDLNHAIVLLDGYVAPSKQQINQNIARGFLAYTHAAMGNYADAKTVSDQIINSGEYSMTTTGQLAFPGAGSGFNDVNTSQAWMWGYDITTEMGHQLLDWWGQVDYFTYSYQWAGDRKTIDTNLLALIPANDVRRTQFGTSGTTLRMPINKFFDPGRTAGGQQIVTTDLVFMRVDEFYLLSAEAAAKTGDEVAAKARLKELLASRLGGSANADAYVDPLSGAALRQAIYNQTRIELWGEGKSYLALKRNQATVTRGTSHVFRAGQSFAYDIDEMSFQIPQTEMNNNPNITSQN